MPATFTSTATRSAPSSAASPSAARGCRAPGPRPGGRTTLPASPPSGRVATWRRLATRHGPRRCRTRSTRGMPAPGPPQDIVLPGPTGESNRLTTHHARRFSASARARRPPRHRPARSRRSAGARSRPRDVSTLMRCRTLAGLSGVLFWGDEDTARAYARALARVTGRSCRSSPACRIRATPCTSAMSAWIPPRRAATRPFWAGSLDLGDRWRQFPAMIPIRDHNPSGAHPT